MILLLFGSLSVTVFAFLRYRYSRSVFDQKLSSGTVIVGALGLVLTLVFWSGYSSAAEKEVLSAANISNSSELALPGLNDGNVRNYDKDERIKPATVKKALSTHKPEQLNCIVPLSRKVDKIEQFNNGDVFLLKSDLPFSKRKFNENANMQYYYYLFSTHLVTNGDKKEVRAVELSYPGSKPETLLTINEVTQPFCEKLPNSEEIDVTKKRNTSDSEIREKLEESLNGRN